MKFHVAIFALAFSVTSAFKISIKQIKRPQSPRESVVPVLTARQSSQGTDSDLDLNTVHDLIYIANITLGGTDYSAQLDTGSSDLWIKGQTTPLPNSNQTAITQNLTYAIGWAYGHIAYAPVQFAGISVASQAFLDVSTALNPALGYGANGIIGLGFTSLSTIDAVVNSSGASTGRSLLFNLFADNPTEPNFIGFALQRSTEDEDEVQGSFSIGEYEPAYAAVADSTAIPTWPNDAPSRWNILLDAVIVGDKIITPTTTVDNAPTNKAVVLLDSGASYTYAPQAICDAIYSNVNGSRYEADLGQWVVPCDSEIDMALQIGGDIFPLHPLDVTPTSLTDPSTCVGSFVPQPLAVGAGEFDWLMGDNFLRSVYSIYDFGDFDPSGTMGNPHVKLLSLINADEASVDFHKIRGGEANTNITYTGLSGASIQATSSLSSESDKTLAMIEKYFPAVLALVALNALVLIILVAFGTIHFCRGRRNTSTLRTTPGRMSSMAMNPRNSYIAGAPSSQPHSYQPVSMAMTEDTLFYPPSPAFHGADGSSRPKSVA